MLAERQPGRFWQESTWHLSPFTWRPQLLALRVIRIRQGQGWEGKELAPQQRELRGMVLF